MTDDTNFFSQFDQQPDQAQPSAPDQSDNFFSQFDQQPAPEPSAAEAFAHHAEASAIPAIAGLPGAGAGAAAGGEVGAAVGGAAGAFFAGVGAVPGAVIGAGVGALGGGIAGFFATSSAAEAAQSYALKAMPDSWQDFLGQSAQQKQSEEEKQPIASFIGGIAPYAITMRPGGWTSTALPENATAFQRLAANPVTAHLFGGAVMGGMELGNEVAAGQKPDWTKVGISTGFGTIFNKPTKIGESLTELGARPVRSALGLPSPANENVPAAEAPAQPAAPETPTVAQAGDMKVMGPGVTEDVFMGSHVQAPEAEMTSQDAARTERMTLNPETVTSDAGPVARQMHPELFDQYDELTAQRDDLAARVAQIGTPADEEIATFSKQRDALAGQLTTLPQSKAVKAMLADAQAQLDEATTRQQAGAESPELVALRQHLATTEAQLQEIAPEIAAAHRRAADAVGGQTVEPEIGAPVSDASRETIEAQAQAIAADVTQRLIAAGRPAEEAKAAGQLLGRHYVTRAARLDNAIGGPQALYESEGPTIRRAGVAPAPEAPAIDPVATRAEADAKGVSNLVDKMIGAGASDDEISSLIGRKLSVDQVGAMRPDHQLAQRSGGELFQTAPAHDTPEFRNWFGDSKVVDEHGAPKVAYHGSARDFEEFDLDKSGTGAGTEKERAIFVTTDPSTASRYAEVQGAGLGENPLTEHGGAVYPVYVKAENPYISKLKFYRSQDFAKEITKAKKNGHDSIMFPNVTYDGERGQIAVFDPTQIKSVNNRGAFDPTDPRILYQSKRASIDLDAKGQYRIIKLFRDANASSFLHETGHQWLDEMMRDAAHPAANDSLKADFGTVRDWLGMKEDQDAPTTRQHEKFARGFEQYMREGVAPSAKLARVFAQFKTWLTSIYQSIKGLGSPINEDIRSVFDRLLETEPQRTVIGEGREGVQGIADLHEHEAATVEPHEAEPALDRIVAERDRVISELPPEVQNELATALAGTNAGTEGGAGAGGHPEVVGGGGEPQPVAPGGAGGSERGPQLAGSPAAGNEGAGLPAGGAGGTAADTGLRGERPGAADNARTANPLAPSPRPVLGAKESPFLDKAGNIRLDTLTNNLDARQAIRDAADRNDDFIGDRGGPVTAGQLDDLAEAAGMEGAEAIVKNRVKGQAFNPVEVRVLRRALIQSSIELNALAKKAYASGSAADELAYVQAEMRHDMLQGTVAQAAAVWGRTGTAFKSLIEGQQTAKNIDQLLRQATGKTLFQTKERIAALALMDRPERVAKFLNDSKKRSLGRMLQYYIVNNLISNPVTHITYAAGNGLLLAKKMVIDTPGAALLGEARALTGYKGDRVRLGEVPAAFAGLWRGLPPALRAVGQAARTGVQSRLPSDASQFTLPFQHGAENATHANVDMTTTWHDLISDGYGMMAGVPNALKAMSSILAGGVKGSPLISARYSHLGPIPDLMVRGVPALPIGSAVGMAGRMTAVIHSLFNVLDYSVDISQRAYRQAVNEGLTGNSLARRVGELTQNPPEDMMTKAVSGAKDMTLMGKSGDFMSRVSRLVDWEIDLPILGNTQPLRFIDPFVKIAGAMAKQSVGTQTPVGLLSMVAPDRSELGADLRGRNGAAAQDMAVAKMVTGTAVALGFLGLKMAGNMTGGGPSDPRQAAIWRMQGNQPYSLRIGDIFVPIHRLGPLGFLAGLGADMFDVSKSASKGDMQKAAGQFLFSFSQNFLDEGFMRGPGDMMKAIENPDREGERYLSNLAGEFIPFSQATNQLAKSLDPYQRQSRTFMDSLKAKLPWISETLEPRRDIFGQPIATLQSGPAFGPTSMYETQFNNDPVLRAFTELGIFPGPVQRTIRGIQLTDQQYDDYSRVAGVTMHLQLEKFVTSPMWQTLPPQARFDLIQAQIKAGRDTARGYVMMKYPSIPAQATANKLAPFQTPDQ